MTRMLYLALMIFPISSYALDFSEYDPYRSGVKYHRGEVVSDAYHLWVARLPSRDIAPGDGRFHWVRVKIAEPAPWHPGRFYLQGDVVTLENHYYLAKRAGFARPGSASARPQWEEFTHPAIGLDLPLVDMEEAKQTLEGVDSNFNGIRDDYEVMVVMESPSGEARQAGLRAATAYKQMVSLAAGDSGVSRQQATEIVDELLTVSACFRSLAAEHQGFSGYQHNYFNTFERIEAYLDAESRLHQSLGSDYQPALPPLPCQQITKVEE